MLFMATIPQVTQESSNLTYFDFCLLTLYVHDITIFMCYIAIILTFQSNFSLLHSQYYHNNTSFISLSYKAIISRFKTDIHVLQSHYILIESVIPMRYTDMTVQHNSILISLWYTAIVSPLNFTHYTCIISHIMSHFPAAYLWVYCNDWEQHLSLCDPYYSEGSMTTHYLTLALTLGSLTRLEGSWRSTLRACLLSLMMTFPGNKESILPE